MATRWRIATVTRAKAANAADTRFQSTVMQFLRSALLGVVLCFSALSHAQSKPAISCAQAVGMGFDKFVEAETARTDNYSTQGTIAACDRYTKCKRATNDRTIKVLSSADRGQFASARRDLGKLESAIWTMVYIGAGGGTMYSQIGAASAATREDVLGDLIGAIQAKSKSMKTTPASIKVLWTQADRDLTPHFKTPTSIQGTAFGSPAEDRKRYASAVRDAQASMKALKVLSMRLPSNAAKIVAERAAYAASTSFEIGV